VNLATEIAPGRQPTPPIACEVGFSVNRPDGSVSGSKLPRTPFFRHEGNEVRLLLRRYVRVGTNHQTRRRPELTQNPVFRELLNEIAG